jgi:hypothetical protein
MDRCAKVTDKSAEERIQFVHIHTHDNAPEQRVSEMRRICGAPRSQRPKSMQFRMR